MAPKPALQLTRLKGALFSGCAFQIYAAKFVIRSLKLQWKQ
jgi:hypothetical protein